MPNNLSTQRVVLFGVGKMGFAYSQVLKALGVDVTIIGRSTAGIDAFYKKTGLKAISGGFSAWKDMNEKDIDSAIVAVNEEELAQLTIELMRVGVKNILLEKPGGANAEEIKLVRDEARKTGTKILIAYNRRFYASVLKAQEMIVEDGGVKSFHFEFTELSHVVPKVIKNMEVLKNWFLVNSTHVIDLAFLLCGKPKTVSSYVTGGSGWHPAATVFSGAGVSETGALFSYHANWDSPGRWGLVINTNKHRFILKPFEKLQVQLRKSFEINTVEVDDNLDIEFKPGIYKETKYFLADHDHPNFIGIDEHYENIKQYYFNILIPHR